MTQTSDKTGGRNIRVLAAGLVGNILEWYDFAVYGFFAPTIGRQFFPSEDPATSLIAAFGAFAAGFLMRPVGAVVFDTAADKIHAASVRRRPAGSAHVRPNCASELTLGPDRLQL